MSNIEIALLSGNGILNEGLRHILGHQSFPVTPVAKNLDQICFSEPPSEDNRHIIIVDAGGLGEQESCYSKLRKEYPEAALVVLADNFEFDSVVQAFRLGADGYLIKSISSEPLVETLRLVALGEKVLPSEMADFLGERPFAMKCSTTLSEVNLSDREIQVLQLLIAGASNKVIGRRLGICEATVKVHVKAALRKLNVSNRTQAAVWAVNRGLISFDQLGGGASGEGEEVETALNEAVESPSRRASYAAAIAGAALLNAAVISSVGEWLAIAA